MGEALTNALSNLQTGVDFIVTQFGTMVSTIANTPILLVGVGIFVVGAAIGLARRLIG